MFQRFIVLDLLLLNTIYYIPFDVCGYLKKNFFFFLFHLYPEQILFISLFFFDSQTELFLSIYINSDFSFDLSGKKTFIVNQKNSFCKKPVSIHCETVFKMKLMAYSIVRSFFKVALLSVHPHFRSSLWAIWTRERVLEIYFHRWTDVTWHSWQ